MDSEIFITFIFRKSGIFIILILPCHFKSSKIKNKCSNCNGLKGLPLKGIIKRDKIYNHVIGDLILSYSFELLYILYIKPAKTMSK